MNLSSWVVSFRQSFRSLTSSGLMSVASIATVAISLLVLAVVVLLAWNVQFAAGTVERQVEAKAYLPVSMTLTPEEGQALAARISAVPGVEKATFISKAEALEQMKKQFDKQAALLEDLEDENPLPDAVQIELVDISQVAQVAAAVEKIPPIERVDYGQGLVEKLMRVTRALRLGGAGLVILLILATVMTISNTIRLAVFARRREVGIMKLVGATDGFIRRPFIIEGIFLGVVGAGVALVCTSLGYGYLVESIQSNIPFLPVIPPAGVIPDLVWYLLGLGAVLGAVGSSISLRRFLKV